METKEVKITIPEGYEIDKENSTFEHIKFKKKIQVDTWKDLGYVKGYFINVESNILKYSGLAIGENTNLFASEKYAKAALALAKISQLMPYYGGEITDKEWKEYTEKYTINCIEDKLFSECFIGRKSFVAFHTQEQAARFLSFPENVQLVKDLYMID